MTIRFDDRGLVPAIVQHADTGEVLTLAYMNREALQRTLAGPDVWFYSRSRGELWHKGETSDNYLKVKSVAADCDADAVLVRAHPTGPACHTGSPTCFTKALGEDLSGAVRQDGPGILSELFDVIEERRRHPRPGSYTASLFAAGRARIAQKVIEEGGEVALAGVAGDQERIAEEMGDLLYHALVMLSDAGVSPGRVWATLRARRR